MKTTVGIVKFVISRGMSTTASPRRMEPIVWVVSEAQSVLISLDLVQRPSIAPAVGNAAPGGWGEERRM
jgi:hypothetical protein